MRKFTVVASWSGRAVKTVVSSALSVNALYDHNEISYTHPAILRQAVQWQSEWVHCWGPKWSHLWSTDQWLTTFLQPVVHGPMADPCSAAYGPRTGGGPPKFPAGPRNISLKSFSYYIYDSGTKFGHGKRESAGGEYRSNNNNRSVIIVMEIVINTVKFDTLKSYINGQPVRVVFLIFPPVWRCRKVEGS